MSKSNVGGLGLKNIQSRLKVVLGEIYYEQNSSDSFYKVSINIPKDYAEKLSA